jgi:hypothetical protein
MDWIMWPDPVGTPSRMSQAKQSNRTAPAARFYSSWISAAPPHSVLTRSVRRRSAVALVFAAAELRLAVASNTN